MNADSDIATHLAAAGLGLILPPGAGANLFTGPVRPALDAAGSAIPSKAVFCLATGGPAPVPYIGTGTDYHQPVVQVRIRGEVGDFAGGLALARGCLTALQRALLAGYVSCLVRESDPNYLGEDDQGHHEWSLNVVASWEG